MSEIPSKQDVIYADEQIRQFIHRTPILKSQSINEMLGAELFFKCENFQKVGAFKMRGASYAVHQLLKSTEKINGLITHSSGNHAQAIALAAKQNKLKAVIVMPENAPKVKIEAVKSYGAEIHFCEANISARQGLVDELIKKHSYTFIHPFDNKDIICGQATCALEIFEDEKDIDAIICPVGGGGLLSGTLLSSQYFSPNTKVYAGEPAGADDAYRSLQSGKRELNKTTNTIADGLLTPLGELNFKIILPKISDIFTVNDKEIIQAMQIIWERMKIIIEPSCAVPLAAIIKNKRTFQNKKIGIILSGGNVDLSEFFKSF